MKKRLSSTKKTVVQSTQTQHYLQENFNKNMYMVIHIITMIPTGLCANFAAKLAIKQIIVISWRSTTPVTITTTTLLPPIMREEEASKISLIEEEVQRGRGNSRGKGRSSNFNFLSTSYETITLIPPIFGLLMLVPLNI